MSQVGDPCRFNNSFPSKNQFITWFTKKFCTWGRRRLAYHVDNHKLGSPAPLWNNPSATFYKVFYILNLISSILFVVFFIVLLVYNASQKANINSSTATALDEKESKCLEQIQAQVKPYFIIIGSFILLINGNYKKLILLATMAKFVSNVKYASDEEWFRYLILNFICCSGLSGFNIAEYFDFLGIYDFLNTTLIVDYADAVQCVFFFKVNLWSTAINMITITCVCVVQITKIFLNFNYFFVSKDDISARQEDKDIIVYTT